MNATTRILWISIILRADIHYKIFIFSMYCEVSNNIIDKKSNYYFKRVLIFHIFSKKDAQLIIYVESFFQILRTGFIRMTKFLFFAEFFNNLVIIYSLF